MATDGDAVSRRAGTSAAARRYAVMGSLLGKPVTIVSIIALLSAAVLFVANHTALLPNHLPKAPPGTTFHAAQDAGAEVMPSHVESPIKPKPAGPAPAVPANPTRSPG